MTTSKPVGWYAASLSEIKDFLDALGEDADVDGLVVKPGDTIVAALISMLYAAPVLHTASAHAAAVVNTLELLEQAP